MPSSTALPLKLRHSIDPSSGGDAAPAPARESRPRFPPPRGGSALLLVAAHLFVWVPSLGGQIQRTVGFHLGQVRSRQLWDGSISAETARGFSLGVNVDVRTPVPVLSIRAEIGYVRRGSVVWDEVVDPERMATANVRSHYLSIPIQGKLGFGVGPVAGYFFAGPAIDQLLETQCTQGICRVLADERPTVFSVSAGSGVSFDVRDRFRGKIELRLTENLTDSYVSSVSGVRYRSLEFLLRSCVPF